ncbi:hypothetical protein ACLOJK_021715 [Asimina triloba]
MEKIVELESDFGDLVGCVSDLKDFQLAESTRLKLTSQAELQQLKEKIRCLEEAEKWERWLQGDLTFHSRLETISDSRSGVVVGCKNGDFLLLPDIRHHCPSRLPI